MTFAKGDGRVDIVDAIKALFELRKDMPDGIFSQVLETDKGKKEDEKDAVVQLDEKALAYMKDTPGSDYPTALKMARSENPELAEEADAGRPNKIVDEDE